MLRNRHFSIFYQEFFALWEATDSFKGDSYSHYTNVYMHTHTHKDFRFKVRFLFQGSKPLKLTMENQQSFMQTFAFFFFFFSGFVLRGNTGSHLLTCF